MELFTDKFCDGVDLLASVTGVEAMLPVVLALVALPKLLAPIFREAVVAFYFSLCMLANCADPVFRYSLVLNILVYLLFFFFISLSPLSSFLRLILAAATACGPISLLLFL